MSLTSNGLRSIKEIVDTLVSSSETRLIKRIDELAINHTRGALHSA